MDAHEPLYILDTELLRREQPDVILTQDLCRVCAVPSGQVQRALDELGRRDAKVVSLDPHTLEDVIGQIEVVGASSSATTARRRSPACSDPGSRA